MLTLRSLFYSLLKFPLRLFVRCKIVQDAPISIDKQDQPIFYIVKHQSASDLLALQYACKQQNLPCPLENVKINNKLFPRTMCLAKPTMILPFCQKKPTIALNQGLELLNQHTLNDKLDVQLIPVNLIWGREPTKEKSNITVSTLLADQESPNWFRKLFIVLFLGRDTLVRFSEALSLRVMADNHGNDKETAHKLLRVARFHFHRQTIAAKGPRLMDRQQMITSLFANSAIKSAIKNEVKNKKISEDKVKKQALVMMKEVAGDYNVTLVRIVERLLHWLWARLYKNIEVHNAKVIRKLAQDGHEIIYVPCHRSHMDYLLLSSTILQEGMVMPRIAAGINLNFWPAGSIFRKGGAFFLRRSFGGNRLYSTIFREYLSLLFERGYSVKYFTEGGRSRTGRLLTPKTGMIAMTIQSLLRGTKRPLTLVPVYLGYEHVMEVGTYHKELRGSQKKNESIFGVIKAIKNLRNYGNGYINFGEPININDFLNENIPQWKDSINPIEPQKPSWLTPSVNILADRVMKNINQSAALNGVALVALILHASENRALTRTDLENQLDFFINIQKHAPYSQALVVPNQTGAELLNHVISLNKVTVNDDSFGSIISLTESDALEMSYYRNNILHTYLLAALICRTLACCNKISHTQLISQTQNILRLLENDFFLSQSSESIAVQTEKVLSFLKQSEMVNQSKAGFWSLTENTSLIASIHLMGQCVDETLQRLAIITFLSCRLCPLSKRDLEEKVVAIAKRLSVLNNINAPEFIDKRAQATLISTMRELGYLDINEQGLLTINNDMKIIKATIINLLDIKVLQSIAR